MFLRSLLRLLSSCERYPDLLFYHLFTGSTAFSFFKRKMQQTRRYMRWTQMLCIHETRNRVKQEIQRTQSWRIKRKLNEDYILQEDWRFFGMMTEVHVDHNLYR
jgi:hypothetical protein